MHLTRNAAKVDSGILEHIQLPRQLFNASWHDHPDILNCAVSSYNSRERNNPRSIRLRRTLNTSAMLFVDMALTTIPQPSTPVASQSAAPSPRLTQGQLQVWTLAIHYCRSNTAFSVFHHQPAAVGRTAVWRWWRGIHIYTSMLLLLYKKNTCTPRLEVFSPPRQLNTC